MSNFEIDSIGAINLTSTNLEKFSASENFCLEIEFDIRQKESNDGVLTFGFLLCDFKGLKNYFESNKYDGSLNIKFLRIVSHYSYSDLCNFMDESITQKAQSMPDESFLKYMMRNFQITDLYEEF